MLTLCEVVRLVYEHTADIILATIPFDRRGVRNDCDDVEILTLDKGSCDCVGEKMKMTSGLAMEYLYHW